MVWEWAYTCTRHCRWSGNGPIPVRGIVGGLGMGLYLYEELWVVWEWAYTCTRHCGWSGNGPIPVRGIVGGLGMGLYLYEEL